MNTVFLSLGSNEGDRIQWLHKAMSLLSETCGIITKQSSIYETSAWGLETQPDFLNMVTQLQTTKMPLELLNETHNIESTLGRQRDIKWGPRTLDLDILFYNNEILQLPQLTIPHPYLQERRFTLLPLSEIAPNFLHPIFQKTINQLLEECPDKLEVRKFDTN